MRSLVRHRKAWRSLLVVASLCALHLPVASGLRAEDWPQWMGPGRDGRYQETGIVDTIPEGGLKKLWSVPLGLGYAGPAVADGRVYVMDYQKESGQSTNNPGGRDELTGQERVVCLDAPTGNELWVYRYSRPYKLSYPNGPRATTTVDGDKVYALGAEGDLLCLSAQDGELIWTKQLAEQYETEAPIWGYATHPLVSGDLVYTLAGGAGSAVVALNKHTGEEAWTALTTDDIGYCPPSIITLAGQPRLIVWHSQSINALDPKTGEQFWEYPLQPRYGMSIAAPQLNNNLLFASGIGETSAMLELDADGRPTGSLWDGSTKTGVYSGNATALFDGDVIYGSDCGSGQFIAVDAKSGERLWQTFALTGGGERRLSHGTAFVVKNGEQYLVFTETGDLVIARFSRDGFEERGRAHLLEPTGDAFGRPVVWSHPAFANQCVYARNDREIVCYSLAK